MCRFFAQTVCDFVKDFGLDDNLGKFLIFSVALFGFFNWSFQIKSRPSKKSTYEFHVTLQRC